MSYSPAQADVFGPHVRNRELMVILYEDIPVIIHHRPTFSKFAAHGKSGRLVACRLSGIINFKVENLITLLPSAWRLQPHESESSGNTNVGDARTSYQRFGSRF